MKLDYLKGIDSYIEQKEEMYHFNSDTVLLGNFIKVKKTDTVLDVGCNNGALLLYASKAKSLCGIDVFDDVISLAKKNLERNHVKAELTVSRLQDYQHPSFDVIISNPPYFNTKNESLKNENKYLKAARHEENLTLEELLIHVSRLLKDNGTFYLVYRPDRLFELFQVSEKYSLKPYRLQIAYASKNKNAKSILIAFKKNMPNMSMTIEEAIFLNDESTYVKGGEES